MGLIADLHPRGIQPTHTRRVVGKRHAILRHELFQLGPHRGGPFRHYQPAPFTQTLYAYLIAVVIGVNGIRQRRPLRIVSGIKTGGGRWNRKWVGVGQRAQVVRYDQLIELYRVHVIVLGIADETFTVSIKPPAPGYAAKH